MFKQQIISENQQIQHPLLLEKEIEFWIKREDKIHPFVSGNKFRKLKYNVTEAKRLNKQTILTFGGAFSNHILATAVAAKEEGFDSVGVIRGEELGVDLKKTLENNSTLKEAYNQGMRFYFITRSQYREKESGEFLENLKQKFGDFYLIPEGGTNKFAVKGCEEILTNQDKDFDYICSCVGTGGTISGLINSTDVHQKVLGFPALKGDFLEAEIMKWSSNTHNWQLIKSYHFGGYAKYSKELIEFMNDFKKSTSIPLDPIYTGKMVFGILDLIRNNYFQKGTKILAIHTGGLQGIKGFNQMVSKKQESLIIE